MPVVFICDREGCSSKSYQRGANYQVLPYGWRCTSKGGVACSKDCLLSVMRQEDRERIKREERVPVRELFERACNNAISELKEALFKIETREKTAKQEEANNAKS